VTHGCDTWSGDREMDLPVEPIPERSRRQPARSNLVADRTDRRELRMALERAADPPGGSAQMRRMNKSMAKAAVDRLKRKLPERISMVRGDRSQRQFARDLGVFQQNVNRYENGTTPHTDFLITLATKENVSLDWLLLGKGKMRKAR